MDEDQIKKIKVERLLIQDEFKGISSSYQFNNKVYSGSWCDDGIQVCEIE